MRLASCLCLVILPSVAAHAASSADPWADNDSASDSTPPRAAAKAPRAQSAQETPSTPRAGAAALQELTRQHDSTVASVRAVQTRRKDVLARLKKWSKLLRLRGKVVVARPDDDLERSLKQAFEELPGLRQLALLRAGAFIQTDAQLRAAIDQALATLATRDPRACFEGDALQFRSSQPACADELKRRCGAFVIDGEGVAVRELDDELQEHLRAVGAAAEFVSLAERMNAGTVDPADYSYCLAAANGGAVQPSGMVSVPPPAPWTQVIPAADLGAADSKMFHSACLAPRRSALAARLKSLLVGPAALDAAAQALLEPWKQSLLLQRDACDEVVQERCKAVKVDGDDMSISFHTSTGCAVREASEKELEKELSFLAVGGLDSGQTGKRLATLNLCRSLREASFRWQHQPPKAGEAGGGCGAPEAKRADLVGP